MAEWKAVYDKSGGYDCITSAYEIERDGETVAVVDRVHFDQVSEWDDEGEKNAGMVEAAEFIAKACNNHEKLVNAAKKAIDALRDYPQYDNPDDEPSLESEALEELREAIALAESA